MALIIAAKRTAFAKVNALFAHTPPEELVAPLIDHLIQQTMIEQAGIAIDRVILGNVLGDGNIARLATLQAGLDRRVPALSIDTQCCSGLDAIATAVAYVQSGNSHCCLAGGVESISLAPTRMRKQPHTEEWVAYSRATFSPAHIGDPDMITSAEAVAKKFAISREAQDRYALQSYQKVYTARANIEQEILPILGASSGYDELPKVVTPQLLKRCPALLSGTITAGNSCDDADGAALVVVVSQQVAKQLQIKHALEVIETVSVGVDPNLLATAVIAVVDQLMAKGLSIKTLDLVELNEAFAVKALALLKKSTIDPKRVNQRGGAIAQGHPYAASGAKLMVSAFYQMLQNDNAKQGLALIAAGGGIGTGVWFRRWQGLYS